MAFFLNNIYVFSASVAVAVLVKTATATEARCADPYSCCWRLPYQSQQMQQRQFLLLHVPVSVAASQFGEKSLNPC